MRQTFFVCALHFIPVRFLNKVAAMIFYGNQLGGSSSLCADAGDGYGDLLCGSLDPAPDHSQDVEMAVRRQVRKKTSQQVINGYFRVWGRRPRKNRFFNSDQWNGISG